MMAVHLIDEPHGGSSAVPDGLALDGVTVGTGASIVVAVAATIALVLTVLVATLSSVVSATAMPSAHGTLIPIEQNFATVGSSTRPTVAAYRIVDVVPPRDGTFAVIAPAGAGSSLAPMVVAGLVIMTAAAGAQLVRALGAGRSLVGRDGPTAGRR